MRWIVLAVVNLLLAVRAVLSVPFRLVGRPPRPRWIRFRLSGDIPWRAGAPGARWRRRGGSADRIVSLEWLRQRLEVYAADPAVEGVLLEFHDLAISPARRDALVGLLEGFKARGKRVAAYAVSVSNGEYALMAHADRIYLSAAGRLELTGFVAEAMSIGEGLRKAGIAPHFVRRGDYKTAPELFTRESLSPIQRETVDRLLDERYADLVQQIAAGRKLSADAVRERIDRGPFSARRAVAEGLADGLVSEARLVEVLTGKSDAAHPPAAGAGTASARDEEDAQARQLGTDATYRRSFVWPTVAWRPWRLPPVVARIPIQGNIVSGQGGSIPMGPQLCGADAIADQLRRASRNPRVKAIVLAIDSPGGSAIASEVMLEAIERADRRTPVVAYCEQVAASGGYMAAVGARELWSSPHAVVGSIGVFAGKFDASVLLRRLGIQREVLVRGRNAGIFSASRGFTDSERAALEADVEETYQAFLEHVARSRELSVAEVHARGEGRIFSGARGQELGLVDRTGSFEDACRRALELAGAPSSGLFAVSVPAAPRGLRSVLGLLRQASAPALYAWAWPWFTLREV